MNREELLVEAKSRGYIKGVIIEYDGHVGTIIGDVEFISNQKLSVLTNNTTRGNHHFPIYTYNMWTKIVNQFMYQISIITNNVDITTGEQSTIPFYTINQQQLEFLENIANIELDESGNVTYIVNKLRLQITPYVFNK